MTGHTYEHLYTDPIATRVQGHSDFLAAFATESARGPPGHRHLDGGRRRSTPAPSSDDDDALITVTYLGSRRLSGVRAGLPRAGRSLRRRHRLVASTAVQERAEALLEFSRQ